MTCECRDDVPEFSLADVSQHCNEESCWIVYLNKVYDITSFMVEVMKCMKHSKAIDLLVQTLGPLFCSSGRQIEKRDYGP